MVLFAPIIKKRMEEKAGKRDVKKGGGRREQCRMGGLAEAADEAQANGQPFDEPSPSQSSVKDGGP